jgi:Xaa-Pro aminopeptidase
LIPVPALARYRERRERLIATLNATGGGIAIIATAPEVSRNADVTYPYRYDSHFHYLCGFPEPDAVLVVTGGAEPGSTLFCRAKNSERETWEGFRFGPEGARASFALDTALPIEELDLEMPRLIANQPAIHHTQQGNAAFEARLARWLQAVRQDERNGVSCPTQFHDLRHVLGEMRLIKDADEIDTMRRAATISASAHVRAMRASRAGLYEYQIEAELIAEFRRLGAQAQAYPPIVAAGANACVLHYGQNDQPLGDGQLLLIDAGCELDGYASDITRTFPVNGRFSGAQRELYELVLAAQAAALEQTRPGVSFNVPHDAATRVLAQGMIDLGLLDGSLDGVLESGSYRRFYMHRTGHWLGRDVHDVGDYREPAAPGSDLPRAWRTLAPGMTLTVEPGIYVRSDATTPERFWNIGIRIEDDVVVTSTGCDVLSHAVPKTVADLEALMRD